MQKWKWPTRRTDKPVLSSYRYCIPHALFSSHRKDTKGFRRRRLGLFTLYERLPTDFYIDKLVEWIESRVREQKVRGWMKELIVLVVLRSVRNHRKFGPIGRFSTRVNTYWEELARIHDRWFSSERESQNDPRPKPRLLQRKTGLWLLLQSVPSLSEGQLINNGFCL